MKTLYESLLDNFDDIDKSFDPKQIVKDWIENNYNVIDLKISDNPNKDGKFEVSATNVRIINKNITSLTNEYFVWKEVTNRFNCGSCRYLKTLEGAPEKVGGDFGCAYCKSLKSLEGAPKEVGADFYCNDCKSLKSLEGAPEKVGGYFDCSYCKSLKSLEGGPKEVGGTFYCNDCKSLTSTDIPTTIKIKGKIYK